MKFVVDSAANRTGAIRPVPSEAKPTAKRRAPRKRRRTQAERTALSDALMFEAAMELIIEQGAHNTTLKAIGERAGYSRGLASNRFGSKEALFSQLIVQFNNEWRKELASRIGGRTGVAACMASLDAVEEFLVNHSDYMQALYILWYESISSHNDVRQHLSAYHQVYRADIERWVREGISAGEIRESFDPACYAFQFCSFIFGTIYQWLVAPERVDISTQFAAYRKASLASF